MKNSRKAVPTTNSISDNSGKVNTSDKRFSLSGRGNGYDGYSMSNNARTAYENGEMPLSKWTKSNIVEAVSEINPDIDISAINTETLKKEFLTRTSWHHTSMYYNQTDFYSVFTNYVKELTQEDVDEIAKNQKHTSKPKRNVDVDSAVDELYAKMQIIIRANIYKKESTILQKISKDEALLDRMYQKAVDIIRKDTAAEMEMWKKRKLPPDHWRMEDVNLYYKDPEGYIENDIKNYSNNMKLSKNSNLFKILASHVSYTANKTAVLYDIVSIKNKKITELLNTTSETKSFQNRSNNSVTNSISDNSGNVNTSDKRFSLPQNAEENKAYSKLVEKHFGTTYNWNETGYLLRNGKKLDFSGKNNGAPGGYRSIDHRDINEAFFDVETFIDEGRFTEEDLPNEELVNYLSDLSGTEAMVDFMQRGNIRIMPETGGINLSVEPTSSQYDSLSDFISRNRGEVILDIDDAKGNTIASVEYSRGTHANRVINDIKNYFANGTIPSVSVVSDFHVRYSLPNDYSYKALTNKPDMKVNYVGNVSVPKTEGRVDRGAVISKSIENIRKYSNKKNTENKVFLFNKDLNRDVKITKESIAHGLRRKSENNAIASLVLGEYFADAICVNELAPRENTDGSYVLLGTFNDNSNDFYVRMVVNNKNNVFEVDDINVLYALNTKKEPAANSRLGLGVETDSLITGSTISIADFLENVKKHFPEVLSEDVLNHFNITRPSNAFNNDLLFSLSPDQIAEIGDLSYKKGTEFLLDTLVFISSQNIPHTIQGKCKLSRFFSSCRCFRRCILPR